MLWFIPHLHFDFIPVVAFKYILCYGSSHRTAELNSTTKNLNTSYVMVHPYIIVSICCTYQNLNTSYVMVHRGCENLVYAKITFKYILCYGSSLLSYSFFAQPPTFKYILCYGSSRHDLAMDSRRTFKYILCYGSSITVQSRRKSNPI